MAVSFSLTVPVCALMIAGTRTTLVLQGGNNVETETEGKKDQEALNAFQTSPGTAHLTGVISAFSPPHFLGVIPDSLLFRIKRQIPFSPETVQWQS